MKFTDEALECIADKAIENKLGARGLRSIMETVMNRAMYEMPSGEDTELVVDINYVEEKLAA